MLLISSISFRKGHCKNEKKQLQSTSAYWSVSSLKLEKPSESTDLCQAIDKPSNIPGSTFDRVFIQAVVTQGYIGLQVA